jgi:preprotein translocase subunit SecF
MAFRFKLAPDNTNFNFLGWRHITFTISICLVLGSIALTLVRGLNFGVDFTGGTVIEIGLPTAPDLNALRADLHGLDMGGISLQEFGDPKNLLLRMGQQVGGADGQAVAVDKVKAALSGKFDKIDYRRVEYVGPQVGKELIQTGLLAMFLSIMGVLLYVVSRFEWQFGVACVLAVIRDASVTVGFFAVTQWEFDLATMGAVLLVAGYSLNDTIVVFDRIRENLRKYRKMELKELFNLSINQTLSRSLMTSFTTLLALSSLAIFGGEVIRGFTCALIVGIVAGTFSSIFVATGPLLVLNLRRTHDDTSSAPATA